MSLKISAYRILAKIQYCASLKRTHNKKYKAIHDKTNWPHGKDSTAHNTEHDSDSVTTHCIQIGISYLPISRTLPSKCKDLPEDQVQHVQQSPGAALRPLPVQPLIPPALL